MLPAHRYRALDDEQEQRLDLHLQECPRCAEILAGGDELGAMLAGWTVEEPSPELSSRTWNALQARLRAPWWKRWLLAADAALSRLGAHQPTGLSGLATVAVAVLLLAQVLSPNLQRGRSSGELVGCQRNQRALSQALERYAREHHGRYPARLRDLRPDYVVQLPLCPETGTDTYSEGYNVAADGLSYRLYCPDTPSQP